MEHLVGSLRIRDNDTCRIVDGVMTPTLLPVGWKLIGDKHNFGHMTYIPAGTFDCKRWSGEENPKDRTLLFHKVVTAPYWFHIEAEEYHDFECIEPGIIHCIFASRDPVTHEVSDAPNMWQAASGLRTDVLPGLTPCTTARRLAEGSDGN